MCWKSVLRNRFRRRRTSRHKLAKPAGFRLALRLAGMMEMQAVPLCVIRESGMQYPRRLLLENDYAEPLRVVGVGLLQPGVAPHAQASTC